MTFDSTRLGIEEIGDHTARKSVYYTLISVASDPGVRWMWHTQCCTASLALVRLKGAHPGLAALDSLVLRFLMFECIQLHCYRN